MVRLDATDRDQRVGAGRDRVGYDVFQLAQLVPAEGETGVSVLALGVELDISAERLGQARQVLDRGGTEGQGIAFEFFQHGVVSGGVGRGDCSEIASNRVGLGAVVMVGVVLDRSTPESFAGFEKAITKLPMVLDCHLVAGDFDYLLKIRVRDIADFNRLHGERLIALPGVRHTRTFFVMKEVTDGAPLDF